MNSVRLISIQDLKMAKLKECDTDSEPIPEKKLLQQFRKEYTDQLSFIKERMKREVLSAQCVITNFQSNTVG